MVVDVESLFQTGQQDKTGQPSYGMCRIKYINLKKSSSSSDQSDTYNLSIWTDWDTRWIHQLISLTFS